jgi:trigger factor
MGMKVEEVKHLELTFPGNFQEKDWAGQTMGVTVYLNSVSAVRLPELDDEFAQSLKTENVEELRQRVRDGLENARKDASNNILADQLLDEVIDRSKVEVSDNMWEPIADQRLAEMDQDLKKQGKSLEEQVKENGMTLEEVRESYRHNAKIEVLRAIVIREIFKNEDMKLVGEDLDQALLEMSRETGLEPAEVIDELKKANATQELQYRAVARKVREFLVAKAEVKEAVGAGA